MNEQIIKKITAWINEEILSQKAGSSLLYWLTDTKFIKFRDNLKTLIDSNMTSELEDSFGSLITFGTGGIRGLMGLGPNRVNTVTIGMAAQALAEHLIYKATTPRRANSRELSSSLSVILAWDTRRDSFLFAKQTACVLVANNIAVKLFDGYRSTPALSFAIRDLQASAGVMISASHNPPDYNGFKVYGPQGGQIIYPLDKDLSKRMGKVTEVNQFKYEIAIKRGLVQHIETNIDNRYTNVLSELSFNNTRDIRIVYTPLHGVGMTSVAVAFQKLGYKDIHYVKEQLVHDPSFSTLEKGIANPEIPITFQIAIIKAASIGADSLVASDPDADRIGCALPLKSKGWAAPLKNLVLNGHQIGVLLCYYILLSKKKAGTLPPKGLFCKTVVTSDLSAIIAQSFGMEILNDLPVGFKHISEAIEKIRPGTTFVFGMEESHGYLADSRIRDKEAGTGILLAEYAALLKKSNLSLLDKLNEIYQIYGYFNELQKSVYLPGTQGLNKISLIMEGLRSKPPTVIGGYPVFKMIDRQNAKSRDLRSGVITSLPGQKVNILIFTFSESDYTRVIVRPSGTEPTIKYYVTATTIDKHLSKRTKPTRRMIDEISEKILTGFIAFCEELSDTENCSD